MGKELVHVYRGKYVESIHCGSVAVVDAEGNLLKSAGDPNFRTFIRSSAKPIQVLPVLFSGAFEKYQLTLEELAVMCASHSGQPEHVRTVRSILNKIGVPEEKLSCGSHPPFHKESAEALIRGGETPDKIHCNCSGKHAGMLTMCAYKGWDLDTYIEEDHPLQQLVLEVMSEVAEIPKEEIWIGTDGCGVPVFGLPLFNMAWAWAKLSKPETLREDYQEPARLIAQGMTSHPLMVAGTDRFCTDLMNVMQGKVIAKAGAEAVYTVGILDQGIGLAVKIDDGGHRGRELVVLKAMSDLGVISQEELAQLDKYWNPVVKNHRNNIVGVAKPVFTLE